MKGGVLDTNSSPLLSTLETVLKLRLRFPWLSGVWDDEMRSVDEMPAQVPKRQVLRGWCQSCWPHDISRGEHERSVDVGLRNCGGDPGWDAQGTGGGRVTRTEARQEQTFEGHSRHGEYSSLSGELVKGQDER